MKTPETPKPDRAASVCPLPFSETYFNGVVDTIGTIAFFEDENEEDGRPGIFVLSTEDDMRSVGPNYFGQKVFLVPEKVLTELADTQRRLITSVALEQINERELESESRRAKDYLTRAEAAEQEAERLRGELAKLKGQKL